jgi:hypothetical protein
MSFKAKFEVDGKEYRVLKCDFSLHQAIDDTGRVSSTVRQGLINIEVESTDDTALFEWAVDHYGRKSGKITFNKRDEDSKLKELEFEEAYLVSYEEAFDNAGTGAMTETVSLSAFKVKLGNGEIESEWVM